MLHIRIKKTYISNFVMSRKKSTGRFVSSGFTLIEIMVTIAIVAILSMMAAPSLTESIENGKVKTLSTELTAALYLTQSEAVKRGIQVSIRPQQTSSNEWQTGWDIFSDLNANGTKDASDELIQTHTITTEGLTLISANSVFATWLGFLPSGAAVGANGISGGFRICRADGNISKARTFIVQATGNVITEVGASSCP